MLKCLKYKLILQLLDIKSQIIQFPVQQKVTKKVTWATDRPNEEKLKKYWKVGIELSINGNAESPQMHSLPQFLSMSEKIVEFTDSTHIIYWPAKMA